MNIFTQFGPYFGYDKGVGDMVFGRRCPQRFEDGSWIANKWFYLNEILYHDWEFHRDIDNSCNNLGSSEKQNAFYNSI